VEPIVEQARGRPEKAERYKSGCEAIGEWDCDVIPASRPNEGAGKALAEAEEGRSRTEENDGQPHTVRTQGRGAVSQGLAGVRGAARKGKETQFTLYYTT